MRITELIQTLSLIKEEYGNIECSIRGHVDRNVYNELEGLYYVFPQNLDESSIVVLSS